MKNKKRISAKTSLIIGFILLLLAICFLCFAFSHPEAAFPFSLRLTFLLYGAYIWLLFKFLVDIPVLRKRRKGQGSERNVNIAIIIMAMLFVGMEIAGAKENIYTVGRGFVILGALNIIIEYLLSKSDKNES
ncbi:MAG: hypothetical protein GX684_04160 [Ruminococcaceae bacterium]|nr:hypothetical protein [Oscillospiraceae bacterium]